MGNEKIRLAPKGPRTVGPSASKRELPLARLLVILARLVYLASGLAAIFTLSYLFGHGMLEGLLGGNDTIFALSLVQWLNRWLPNLPLWYPLQGAGTSLPLLYPMGTHLLVVLVQHITGLTAIQAFRLVAFLSVPLTATGIYFLVWIKLRNQTMALLGGLLYPLSAASWEWLTRIGLYGQMVSLAYFAPTFLLFDAYMSAALRRSQSTSGLIRRLSLPASALAFSLMFVSHPGTAATFSMAILMYAIVLPLVTLGKQDLWRNVLRSGLRAVQGIVAGLGLAAVWLIPFVHANSLANREGLSDLAPHQIPYLDIAALLGLGSHPIEMMMWSTTLATPVVILAAVGVLVALLRRSAAAAWGIVAIYFVFHAAMPGLWPELVRTLLPLWTYTYVRVLIATMILLPAVAGYGAGALAHEIISLPSLFYRVVLRKRPKSVSPYGLWRSLKSALVMILAVAFGWMAVSGLREVAPTSQGYGPPGASADFSASFDDWRAILRTEIPEFTLSTEGDVLTAQGTILELNQQLGFDSSTRLDVSPNFGGITQRLPLYSDASMVNIYALQASLIHAMWGYQQGLFFGESEAEPQLINELAKWFGIQYVVLNRPLDSSEKYDPDLWPVVYPKPGDDEGILEVRHFVNAPAMASLLRAPALLVVGGYENSIYEQVFRTFAKAGISYDQALIVEGTHNIDDYSLDELKRFDAVLLHGYGYKKPDRAWGLLERYVKGGGSLYIDTGWQFFTPDWEMEEAPAVLPMHSLTWTNLGMTDDFAIEHPSFASAEASEFSPLIWGEQPWSVSSPSGGLRDWAQPVLSMAGNPLIAAGEYGQGRVVWSGMNLIGHTSTYDNAAEREFFRQLIGWLAPAPADGTLADPTVLREHPDHIRFVLQEPLAEGAFLLWREAFSPNWHASVEVAGRKVAIPINRAGPGMMLLRLPAIDEPGATVRMDFSLGWRGLAGVAISVGTIVALVANAVAPGVWPAAWARIRPRSREASPRGSVSWLPDVETAVSVDDAVRSETYSSPTRGEAATKETVPSRGEAARHEPAPSDVEEVGASLPTAVETELHLSEDVEALWRQWVESRDVPSAQERDSDRMIARWRRSRETGENG